MNRPAPLTGAPSGGILGRGTELRILDAALDRMGRGGSAVAIHGDAGTGKSTLLDAVREGARLRDFVVLTASGVETEKTWPFAGLHQMIAPLLDALGVLPPPQRAAISIAFGIEYDAAPEPFLVGLAALSLLSASASHRPIVLAVDDVQWLDSQTQDALAFLSRRVVDDRILVVGTVRGTRAAQFVDSCNIQLEVGGLDESAARELLDKHGGVLDAATRECILGQARGNPLALVELPAMWRLAGAPTDASVAAAVPLSTRLERAFVGGLDVLPCITRDVLLVAALGTRVSTAEILAAAAVLSGSRPSLGDVDPAVETGLLRVDEARMHFRHPLARCGVVQAESARRRQLAHRALAEVLADDPFRAAWHRAQAIVGHDDDIADELADAYTSSLRRGAIGAEPTALEHAARVTSDSEVRGHRLLLAAEDAFGVGLPDTVDRLVTAASRHDLSESDVARREWLREVLSDGSPGDAERVTDFCGMARFAADAGDVDVALNLLSTAALRCWWADMGQVMPRHIVLETARLVGVQDDPRYIATLALAEPVRECKRVRELLSGFNPNNVVDGDALRLLGQAAHAIGDPVRAIQFFDRAEARLRAQGRFGLLAHVLTMSTIDRIETGDWHRLTTSAVEARRLSHESGQPIWTGVATLLNAIAAGLLGDFARAQDLAAQAETFAHERRLNYLLAHVQLARGYACLNHGRFGQAYAALRRLFDPTDSCHHRREKFRGVMLLAEAAVPAKQVTDARRWLRDLEESASVGTSPALDVELAYARAVLADDDCAEGLFRDALESDLAPWPLPRARLQLAFGSWLRRQRRPAESRDPLRSAAAAFSAIGATSWYERARGELRAAGEVPDGVRRRRANEVLSAQEFQIARLVAEGLTNKQIGERLDLSPRTIGTHLYRMFPKLGVTSRSQMASHLMHEQP